MIIFSYFVGFFDTQMLIIVLCCKCQLHNNG